MKVLRLDHVNIRSGRFEESIGFYVGCLGLRHGPLPGPFGEPGSEMLGAWLSDASGVAIVHLLHEGETPMEGGAAIDHFALRCDDYDAFAARLAERGVGFEAADFPEIGARQIVVHDPNGVKIELNFMA